MQTADTVKVKRCEMEKWLSAEEKEAKDWFTQKKRLHSTKVVPASPNIQVNLVIIFLHAGHAHQALGASGFDKCLWCGGW